MEKKRTRDKVLQRIKAKQQTEEDRQKIEKEAYLLWEADGKSEGKDDYYWTLATYKIKTEESFINKVTKVLVNNRGKVLVKGGTILTVLAAFGAFALSMRQKEFDRFSLVKPLFEVEQLDNKDNRSKFKILNHGGIVYFIGCKKNDPVLINKLERTPRQYSSLSKTKSIEFVFKQNPTINEGDYFFCYYRDVDLNLYELKLVYEDTNGFYIDESPLVYRSDLFVTMSRKCLDTIVTWIFPKDWYSKDETLRQKFKKCFKDEQDKLDKIDGCLGTRIK